MGAVNLEIVYNKRRRERKRYGKSHDPSLRLSYWNAHPGSQWHGEDPDEAAQAWFNERFPNGIEGRMPRPICTPSTTTREPRSLMSRLFSLSHREVYDLFRDWGWVDGPERGDGHRRMIWFGDDGMSHAVQIMPPNRPGTGEQGNSLAMKKAWVAMKLSSLQEFLDGPPDAEDRRRRIERADRLAKAREEAVFKQAAQAAREQEKHMTDTKAPVQTGGTKIIAKALAARPNKTMTIDQIVLAVKATEGGAALNEKSVRVLISQMSQRSKYPEFKRVGRGRYRWEAETIAPPAPPKTTPISPIPAPQPSTPLTPPPLNPPSAPATTSLNGQTPELLSRVHVLDGGRYLFQGDDGRLYVVSSIVRLDV